MDVKLINPFIEAVVEVAPQLGFQNVSSAHLVITSRLVCSKGVTVQIGISNQLMGKVAYNLDEKSAKKIASTMMCGMPVVNLDNMAQSALSELVNMVTARAAINFEGIGINVDITTPNIELGENKVTSFQHDKLIGVTLLLDNIPMELNIGISLAS